MDFSKLTLHQAKRLEMESQVHVLELESQLEKERRSLSELRKTHYRLAAESEGWEQEVRSVRFSLSLCDLTVMSNCCVCSCCLGMFITNIVD